jgi:hypothetical protein
MSRREGCIEPAGGRPVRVSVGAPGSRPQFREEIPGTTAGRQEHPRMEQECGPQHKVKPAASSDLQWGSRAAHVTAKATSAAHKAETASAADSSGVLGAARIQGAIRNTGDPSEQPTSGRDRSYKPKAKAGGVQRESEGIMVLTIPAKNNAGGGTGPCFGQVVGRGKREGMTAKPSNFPAGLRLSEKVRELGTRLYADAKRSSEVGTTSRTQPLGVTPHGSVATYLREDVHATHEDHR